MSKAETVWAFDLDKGSIGEAVRQGTEFRIRLTDHVPLGVLILHYENSTAPVRHRIHFIKRKGFCVASGSLFRAASSIRDHSSHSMTVNANARGSALPQCWVPVGLPTMTFEPAAVRS